MWLMDCDVNVRKAYENVSEGPNFSFTVHQAGADTILPRGARLIGEAERSNDGRFNAGRKIILGADHGYIDNGALNEWSTFTV